MKLREYKEFYMPKTEPTIVTIPKMNYIAVRGQGDPSDEEGDYKAAMPEITPHVCRHTYCSNMAKSGMNPKTLQYLMGHADIGTTLNVYTHVNFEGS